jgi:rhamnosyltransferase
MKVDIICPLSNAEDYIKKLYDSLINQKNVDINQILFLLTESTDNSEEILKKYKMKYILIPKNEFSHSLTREKYAMKSTVDIICFITQDIIIESNDWLEKLIKPIIDGEAIASYSRQLTKYNNLEKYTREYNYPQESKVKSREDISKLGLKTFFSSDASAAIKKDIFVKLNGYDGKNLPISEDMYFTYKLIMNGYKVKYCADSVIYHSHNFTLKEIYNRYKLTGKFFKENAYLDKYGTINSGSKLAKYVLKRILEEHRFGLLIRYPFDMAARLLGMKAGRK